MPGDVKSFLQKAVLVQIGRKESNLTEEQLKKLAAEYGISDSDWEKLQAGREGHITRGRGFLDRDNDKEAIPELEQAATLAPWDASLQVDLGLAYGGLWEDHGDRNAKKRAEEHFREALRLDAGNELAMDELDDLTSEPPVVMEEKRTNWAALIGSIVAGILVASFLPGFLATDTDESQPAETPGTITNEQNLVADVGVALELPSSGGLEFDAPISELTRYDGSFSYTLRGRARVGGQEIRRLAAKLELLDASGQVFASDQVKILPEHEKHSALPGDTLPFYLQMFQQRELPGEDISARLILGAMEATPFSGEPEPGRLVVWQDGQMPFPGNMAVEVRQRSLTVEGNDFLNPGKPRVDLVLELRNTGQRAIQEMKLGIHPLGAVGQPLEIGENPMRVQVGETVPANVFPVVLSLTPAFKPGEQRVISESVFLSNAAPEDVSEVQVSLWGVK